MYYDYLINKMIDFVDDVAVVYFERDDKRVNLLYAFDGPKMDDSRAKAYFICPLAFDPNC